jgi:hypothetical protein
VPYTTTRAAFDASRLVCTRNWIQEGAHFINERLSLTAQNVAFTGA